MSDSGSSVLANFFLLFLNQPDYCTFAGLKLKSNMNNYETVFILNPVLSDDQAKDTVEKFVKVLKKANATILNNEQWGLKKMAYPINKNERRRKGEFKNKENRKPVKKVEEGAGR